MTYFAIRLSALKLLSLNIFISFRETLIVTTRPIKKVKFNGLNSHLKKKKLKINEKVIKIKIKRILELGRVKGLRHQILIQIKYSNYNAIKIRNE